MRPTGPRSRTKPHRGFVTRWHRPGQLLGRCHIAFLIAITLLTATPSHAAGSGDLFSWWTRQILPISFEPGGWVRVAREDIAEGSILEDVLTCRVLAAPDDATRWLAIASERDQQQWYVKIEPARLTEGATLLEAIHEVVRLEDGALVSENLGELKASEFAQRTLEDVFEDPSVEREAMPDSLIADTSVTRQRVVLSETLETRLPMGDRTLIHATELRSEAVVSAQVPVLGLLFAETTTVASSRWEGNVQGTHRPRPPLMTTTRTRCLGFGVEPPQPIPAGLSR